MGCGASKLEEQEAVSHCRERSNLLYEAIRYRYAMADAHVAYIKAVQSLSPALLAFLNPVPVVPASPLLTLPPQRKREPSPLPVPIIPVVPIESTSNNRASHSDGPHIHFYSSDSESDNGSHIHFHSDEEDGITGPQPVNPSTRFHMKYARNQPPAPSVSYEQRVPDNPQTVYPSYYNNDPYPPQNFPSYPSYPYPSYPTYSGYGEMGGGYFGQNDYGPPMEPTRREEMPPAPPPAPPSPPRVSTWDFLNPFQSYDNYYSAQAQTYTPSRSSKSLREEEGIPDLEEEQEVVKAAYGDGKKAGSLEKGDGSADPHRKSHSIEISSTSSGNEDSEIHVVEKNVVGEAETSRRSVGNLPVPVGKTYTDDLEVVREIKTQFEKVCESANQVSQLLEVGKQPYQQKNSPLKDSLRMICGLPSTSRSDEDFLNFEEDNSISSTLQKLYMWEKKLLEEVKIEEEMRVLYDNKRQELRNLDERGAEPQKIEATENRIRKYSTRISIAMQVVNTISNKINKLRDQELWPQICHIIQGLTRMWVSMSECHSIQTQAISFAKNLDSILTAHQISSMHLDATKNLEIQLLEFTSCFSSWILLQKSYIRTLNKWLVKGLNYVEEITEDGPVPFSPGRLGAPPVFVVLNQWAKGMDSVSEEAVLDALKDFASVVYRLWDRYRFEQRQSLMANKEGMDRALRVMERDEQEMRRAAGKLEISSVGETGEGIQASLKRMFEEMKRFSDGLVKVYEDLNSRVEEEKERLAKENSKVP